MAEASVLIVDDDRSIVRLCQRLLERAGFKVFASTDPMEAIKILETRKIDLLLSDIRMPVMDGFELIEKAKGLQPDIAVLVMTGFGTVDTAIQALYRGVDGLILKPFENTADLVRASQRVLDGNRQKQDAARAQALRPLFDLTETLLAETSLSAIETLATSSIMEMFQACTTAAYRMDDMPAQTAPDLKVIMSKGVPVGERAADLLSQLVRALFEKTDAFAASAGGQGDPHIQELLRGLGWSSVLTVPIHRNHSFFVFLTARAQDAGTFSPADLELFTILVRQTMVAMDNARLYTDLRNSLMRIEESQRALVQAEKMAAVGRLMASLAHEINNPLQAVRNCLHLANRPEVDEKQRSSYLAMTNSELDRLVKTVRHMLDFYRPGLQEKETVQLRDAVERVLYLLKSQFDLQRIKVSVEINQDCPPVIGVRDQVQQVFFNLLLNSMDALEGKENKQIWVETEVHEPDLYVYVEDSGMGIPLEIRERIFEPFVSTKKNGTGLGLSVSYGVVEAHGGKLSLVPSRHGQGACFEIRFPLPTTE
jgi:signal transduction histidine kinase